MRHIAKHRGFLEGVCELNGQQRKALLKHITPAQVRCLSELALNLKNNNIPVTSALRSKLKRHKRNLRALANTRTSARSRRKIILQSGGFLPLLIKPALGLIGSLLSGNLFGSPT
jgi:hypothetical protein